MKYLLIGITCLILSSCFEGRDVTFSVPSVWTLEKYEIKIRYGQEDQLWLYYRDDYHRNVHIVFRPVSDTARIRIGSRIGQYIDKRL